jgi:hypothetical protein
MPAQRPEPPAHLDAEAQDIWHSIVNRMPADWFPAETHPLLTELCSLTVMSRKLGNELAVLDAQSRDDYLDLIHDRKRRLKIKVSTTIGSLSRYLRITNVKRLYGAKTRSEAARAASAAIKPWDGRKSEDQVQAGL